MIFFPKGVPPGRVSTLGKFSISTFWLGNPGECKKEFRDKRVFFGLPRGG
ncbi:hypothetical protein EBI_26502 [Enterocytozoon bieneusi H348]|nr:hypothetical protein EBI_26502 [Enterocytozoon bieneusi H348]|eukprot:XP_002651345.1 hypothetical protein EBI_26502 [Enterocytozoon bieneusi H348]